MMKLSDHYQRDNVGGTTTGVEQRLPSLHWFLYLSVSQLVYRLLSISQTAAFFPVIKSLVFGVNPHRKVNPIGEYLTHSSPPPPSTPPSK